MKLKLSKVLKVEGTKKAKTGRTKVAKSRTPSTPFTSQTSYYLGVFTSNLKDICLTQIEESLNVSGDLTPISTCELFLVETTQSGKTLRRSIRIGPSGLEYRGPLDEEYRKIGWNKL